MIRQKQPKKRLKFYHLRACMLLLFFCFSSCSQALPVSQPKTNVWVALAKSAGSDTICLSDTSPDKPFSTCLVGVPLPEGFDNVTFDKYWPYDDHHISPTPSQRHQTYIDNSKVDKSDLQELEILGSLTMSTCYFFHFRGENGPHLNVTPYHPVYSNMTSWCNQTKLLVYDEPHADRFNKLPIRFPKGIWLICGDRAWQGIPSKIDGGPCAMGQLTVIAPSVKKVVKKKSRRIRSSWGHEYESNCDSNFHPWNSGESIAASIFLPQLSSSIALKQLNKLGCWLSKEVNATSTMISDLLTDEEAIRHATLQNRAAIDYLLLAHGHGCEDFEEGVTQRMVSSRSSIVPVNPTEHISDILRGTNEAKENGIVSQNENSNATIELQQ
ncbi:hypothetical protein DUI87_16440 [Hirundo rustica rustica]|uniref:Uncharacterized protein n=1 Tax=Hirundo rustica rustica TaxID=333673 RepID=A0A3M0KIH7_HIRRU|nr:hypothetical protein DUI87_16440 [Hirundo rustica rustica]